MVRDDRFYHVGQAPRRTNILSDDREAFANSRRVFLRRLRSLLVN